MPNLLKINNPFDRAQHEIIPIPTGITLSELRRLSDICGDNLPLDQKVAIAIDGKVIPPEQWDTRIVHFEEYILIMPKVADEEFLRIAAFITLAVLAPGIGAGIAKGIFGAGGWMATAFTVGIMIGGGMIINSLGPRPELPSMEFNKAELSQSFGWNPQTVQKQGTPKPRIYGLVKSHGNVIETFREVTGATTNIQRLFAKLALGDGPIREPCVPGTFRINDQLQKNFSSVSYDKRYGTLSQKYMPWFEKCTADIIANIRVTNSGGAKIYETKNSDFDNLIIVLNFPGGLYDGTAGIANHTVNIKIEVKRVDASAWQELTTADITDGTIDKVIREYPTEGVITILRGYRWQVRLTKNTADKNSNLWGDDLYIDSVKEITDEQFIHPVTSLIGINAIATGELSGNIRASFHTKGRYIRVYDGASWSIKYSNSSGWVVNDIFTQPVLTGDVSPFRYLSLLLHLNGIDETTETIDKSDKGHLITFTAHAQLDTTEKKFGTASLLLDGIDDDIWAADSPDWDIIENIIDDWTIDFFVKHTDHIDIESYMNQYEDINNRWAIFHSHNYGLRFVNIIDGNIKVDTDYGGEITDSNWHHIALCKVGANIGLYKDGTQIAHDLMIEADADIYNGPLQIGKRGANDYWFQGHIDHLRIIKKNIFNAAPNVGLTNTITEPTEEYTDPGNSFAVSRYNCYQLAQMDLPAFEDMETWCDAARVNPDNIGIISISQATYAVIVTTSKHNRKVGDTVLFRGVAAAGMVELVDGTTAVILSVTDDNTFTIDLDTSGYSAYTGIKPKLLVHFDGVAGSTEFTDEIGTHTITTIGDVKVSATKKFGSGSGLFYGTDDALSIPDHVDWDVFGSNADDWTIDFFVKHTSLSGYQVYVTQEEAAGGNFWVILFYEGAFINHTIMRLKTGGVTQILIFDGGGISDFDWHHIAMCKIANKYGLYLDGVQIGYVQDDSTDTFADKLYIGSEYTTAGGYLSELKGYMDELCIIDNNRFNASPNVGKTDTITVPKAQLTVGIGTVEEYLPRFNFNGIIDTTKNVWETALEVCRQCRCVPYWKGSKISIAIDKATPPSYAFTMGNTIEDSFKMMKIPADERASRIEVHYQDESEDFKRLPFIWPNRSAGNVRNQIRMDLFGVTHRTIAQSLADRQLKENQYVNWLIQQRVDIDAIGVLIGNVVLVQNDIANWGEIGELSQDYTGGGRILSAINGANPTVIIAGKIKFLDADFDGGSTTYKMMVKTKGDTNETITITGFDGNREITLDSQFTNLPREGDIWAAGKQNLETKQFRVMDIQLSSILQADILLKEYRSECYEDD